VQKILIGPSRNTPANRNSPTQMTVRERIEEVQKILIGPSRNTPANNLPTQMTVRVRIEEVQKILIGPPRIRQPIGTYQHR
jgi:hypothetical protein